MSISSPPCYTSCYGYKMCARVFITSVMLLGEALTLIVAIVMSVEKMTVFFSGRFRSVSCSAWLTKHQHKKTFVRRFIPEANSSSCNDQHAEWNSLQAVDCLTRTRFSNLVSNVHVQHCCDSPVVSDIHSFPAFVYKSLWIQDVCQCLLSRWWCRERLTSIFFIVMTVEKWWSSTLVVSAACHAQPDCRITSTKRHLWDVLASY